MISESGSSHHFPNLIGQEGVPISSADQQEDGVKISSGYVEDVTDLRASSSSHEQSVVFKVIPHWAHPSDEERLSRVSFSDEGEMDPSIWRDVDGDSGSLTDDITTSESDGPGSPSVSINEDLFNDIEKGCDRSQQMLAEAVFFGPNIFALRNQVQLHRVCLISLQTSLKELSEDQLAALGERSVVLRDQKIKQLESACDHLALKEAALTQYLRSDPFNDKNVLRPRRLIAEGFKKVSDQMLHATETRLKALAKKMEAHETTDKEKNKLQRAIEELNEAHVNFKQQAQHWYEQEVRAYDEASADKRSQDPGFYKRDHSKANPLVSHTRTRAMDALNSIAEQTGIDARCSKKDIKVATQRAMNEVIEWPNIERDMTVTLDRETKHFRHFSKPLSNSRTAVGHAVKATGVRGMIPEVRDDGRAPTNARMTRLEVVLDEKNEDGSPKTRLIHERQQHGVVDHFHLDEPKRTEANRTSAQQLIQHGMEADAEFITALLNKKETGDVTPGRVFYINTNLTTPTSTPRDLPWKRSTHDEREYSAKQGEALRAASGKGKTFSVLDLRSVTDETEEITVDVEMIDLRFPVNYALGTLGGFDLGMNWEELHTHNAGEFRKLFGGLGVKDPIGGLIGPTYQKLQAIVSDTRRTDEERLDTRKIMRALDEQCTYIRSVFADKSYQSAADGDRFKMPRHIDLLVNSFREATRLIGDLDTRVINAGGCMSGKDREGIANAEAETAAMIHEMGDSIMPGERLNHEKRAIYNTAVTLVVDNTLQVTGYAGSKNAEEVASRIGDHHAVEYAAGLSHNAKT